MSEAIQCVDIHMSVHMTTHMSVHRYVALHDEYNMLSGVARLYRLYLGIADGMSIVQVWAYRYSK